MPKIIARVSEIKGDYKIYQPVKAVVLIQAYCLIHGNFGN